MNILRDFIDVLSKHTDKKLVFQYAPGKVLQTKYHITEVKTNHIESVDCGGDVHEWFETVIQLWESNDEIESEEFMTVAKAMQILKRVSQVRGLHADSAVKIEYGNADFHKAQLDVEQINVEGDTLKIDLYVSSTDCKAKDACGIQPQQESSCCTPGGGCC